jgi:hypothetical protein
MYLYKRIYTDFSDTILLCHIPTNIQTKEGRRKEGRRGGRNEGRKEGRMEGRQTNDGRMEEGEEGRMGRGRMKKEKKAGSQETRSEEKT